MPIFFYYLLLFWRSGNLLNTFLTSFTSSGVESQPKWTNIHSIHAQSVFSRSPWQPAWLHRAPLGHPFGIPGTLLASFGHPLEAIATLLAPSLKTNQKKPSFQLLIGAIWGKVAHAIRSSRLDANTYLELFSGSLFRVSK